MKIYNIFLLLSLVVCWLDTVHYQLASVGTHLEKRAGWLQAVLFFGVLIFFCGLRSGIADTSTYIHMFQDYPNRLQDIDWSAITKDRGFYLLSVLYKQYLSEDYHGWLFIMAAVSGIAVMLPLKKYSPSFGLSCYLFLTTTLFANMINGIRQFLCASILFCAMDLIWNKKFLRYLLLLLLLATVHGSVLLMLPVYFLAGTRPWSRSMWFVMGAAVGFGVFFHQLFPILGHLLENTQYDGYVGYLETSGVGSNVLRLLIAAVPCVLAFCGRRILQEEGSPVLDLAVNMSILNLCVYVIATFSSGVVFGRLTVFFELYQLILLPWMLKYLFNAYSSRIMTLTGMAAYLVFFYYQTVQIWQLPYESDILHLFC